MNSMLTSLAVWTLIFFTTMASADFAVPDPAWQKCLETIAQKNNWTRAEQFEQITCHNKGIRSVDGLEQFTAITKLSLYKNKIVALELPASNQLYHLNIAGNALGKLNIHNCEALKVLYAFHNKLRHISIEGCPELTQLKANNNQLQEAHLGNLPVLKKLHLFNNELETLDIKSLKHLRYLDVRQNPMPDDFYDYLDTVKGLTSLHDGNAEDWD